MTTPNTRTELQAKLNEQLAWRGSHGSEMGHILVTRAQAEYMAKLLDQIAKIRPDIAERLNFVSVHGTQEDSIAALELAAKYFTALMRPDGQPDKGS